MNVYCSGPIKGDVTFQKYYLEIIKVVESLGHKALSELSTNLPTVQNLSKEQIYSRDIDWLENSGMMIAEVSGASLGVGFEIAYALFVKQIPVLAVYSDQAKKVSAMITGCNNENLTVKEYSDEKVLKEFIRDFLNSQ